MVVGKTLIISPERMFIAIFVYVIGLVLMMASDTQKYFVLKMAKEYKLGKILIKDGWFLNCRNTNYTVKLCYIHLLQFAHSRGFRGSCTVCYGV